MALPSWPPSTSSSSELLHTARDYALSHGILYRPLPPVNPPHTFHTSAIHAPFALFPTPFPRIAFEKVVRIQRAYNELYAAIARDDAFLEKVVGGNVVKVDEFQRGLWEIYRQVKQEGSAQPLALGLFRSDYLLHDSSEGTLAIKQVEFNTISSSFGSLSTRVTQLHQYLARTSEDYASANPPIKITDLPNNAALQELARGLADAHAAYGKKGSKVLFVVQENERNAFDQRPLEWELAETHGVQVLRLTFDELQARASLSSSRTLLVSSPASSSSASSNTSTEISVVYFRAGYSPTDYPGPDAWSTRLLLERSSAIKCPSVGLQLAGAKKIQQVLTEPGVLERFAEQLRWSEEMINDVRETFTDLYPMDDASELGREGNRLAKQQPERFVLKPQREGGGNNIYRTDIPPFLAELEEKDRKARQGGALQEDSESVQAKEGYILMGLIQPPQDLQNALVRAPEEREKIGRVVSELGVYGVALFDEDGSAAGSAEKEEGKTWLRVNRNAGHLLRTKGAESDEGGVAVGFSVVDSPFLVDV